ASQPVTPSNDCYYFCGPGGYPASEAPAGSSTFGAICCTDLGLCPTDVCNCPPSADCICGPQCGACPAGWQAPPNGQIDLCCRTAAGTQQCFSEANNTMSILGPGSCSGNLNTGVCQCTGYGRNGDFYAVSCDPKQTPSCECAVNGAYTMGLPSVESCSQ